MMYLNARRHNKILKLYKLLQIWIGWFGCAFDLVIDGLWVQTLPRTN